ncbi:cell division cycle 2, cofactor of APC complex [Thraustotheca clavata]|uniref:Cell division cycle 2, cofactor of APC complex n=1 Tax=Thraustotheca clavata TaxID=74557 RepID=A0A1V9YWM6_9STRA|nr:cell division cycle 2, cofactor of APC complex [Thraustotheca clavata]
MSSTTDMDSLMDTINNAVARISAIRESFEENPHYPPPRPSSTSSSCSLTKTRSRSSMPRTSSFEDALRASNGSTGSYMRPPLSRTSSTSSTTSSGSSTILDRRSSKSNQSDIDSEDGDRFSGSDRGIRKPKVSLPFPYNKLNSSPSMDLENLTPFKEERLLRMQNIKVTFQNGLPQDFYKAIGRFLKTILEVKRRFHKLKPMKDCFLGSDAVGALMFYGFAIDENEAILIGNVLLKLGYIEDCSSHPSATIHNRSDAYYRFSKVLDVVEAPDDQQVDIPAYRESIVAAETDAPLDKYSFADASDEMHALISEESLAILSRVMHHVLEKKNKLLFHKGHVGCFMGGEMVAALREMKVANSTIDAVLIGQCMFEDQLIVPIDPKTTSFQNRSTMFRLVSAAPPTMTRKKWTKGDRFIPNRRFMNVAVSTMNVEHDLSHHTTPFHAALGKALLDEYAVATVPILEFRKRDKAKVISTTNTTQVPLLAPTIYHPVKSLDAPYLVDDFYLNTLCWVGKFAFAIALGSAVYVYDVKHNAISEITSLGDNLNATAIQYLSQGVLAIGTGNGQVQIWDLRQHQRQTQFHSNQYRIGAMAKFGNVLTTGSMDATIVHHDIRINRYEPFAILGGHFGEVCGLKWSSDGKMLASGSSDRLVCIWKKDFNSRRQYPLHTISEHKAAVKALAWSRYTNGQRLLVTGGGINDRSIKRWRISYDACTLLHSKNVNAQVTGLYWTDPEVHANDEIISAQGEDIIAWDVNNMNPTATYEGHTNRILNMILSPSGSIIISSGADETVRIWQGRPLATIPIEIPTPSFTNDHFGLGVIR